MTTYTLTGMRLTGSIDNGTLAYAGSAILTVVVPEDLLFDYRYTDPATESTFVNAFGIPEIEDLSNSNFDGYTVLDNGVNPEEVYLYQLNATGGNTTVVIELFDEDTDVTYIYAIGGTNPTLATSQAELDAAIASFDPNGPVSTVPSPGPVSLNTWANVVVTENDLFYDDQGLDSMYSGGIGDDTFYVLDGNDTVFGGAGSDRIVATGGVDNEFFGQGGTDILKLKGNAVGSLHGGDGDDKLIGGVGDDELFGEAGSDIAIGLDGMDSISGGIGNDFLYGGRGNDTVHGDEGDDVVRGNRNNDTLYGDEGTDRLYGGGNNDQLFGGDDRDFLLGENGNDLLNGGGGNDNLTGGAGNDIFAFETGGGFDRVIDFENGLDIFDVIGTGATALGDIAVSASGADVRLDFGGGDVLYLVNTALGDIDAGDFLFAI